MIKKILNQLDITDAVITIGLMLLSAGIWGLSGNVYMALTVLGFLLVGMGVYAAVRGQRDNGNSTSDV